MDRTEIDLTKIKEITGQIREHDVYGIQLKSRFHIGVTRDLDTRLGYHVANDPDARYLFTVHVAAEEERPIPNTDGAYTTRTEEWINRIFQGDAWGNLQTTPGPHDICQITDGRPFFGIPPAELTNLRIYPPDIYPEPD